MADPNKTGELSTLPYPSQPPPSYPMQQQSAYPAPYPTTQPMAAPYPTTGYVPQADGPGAPAAAPQPQYFSNPDVPPPAYTAEPAPNQDAEVGFKDNDGMFAFDDKSVRLAFIRKVYGVLALQLVFTVALSCFFMFHEPTKLFVQKHIAFYLVSYGLFITLYFILLCCTKVARSYPSNMILLSIFTMSLSYMVAAITSYHDTKIVLLAFGMTLLICTSVMLFACQTKYDFTTCGGFLFCCCLALIFFGLFASILVPLGQMKIVSMVYAGLGTLLFVGFLAFDTQLIMGGRKYEIDPEDYVFAAMMLYVDVIYIFLYLLYLFGGNN